MSKIDKSSYEIRQISHGEAKSFIEAWHYSKRCPTGKNIFFGWFIRCDKFQDSSVYRDIFGYVLYAVADYGIGVNTHQASFLSRLMNIEIDVQELLELKRLCRIEPKNDLYPLSAFLSKCHKLLKKMGYRYIVSFSDPNYGHDGGIYKASNFEHIGKTNPEIHTVDETGETRHRRFYYRYSRRNNVSVKEAKKQLHLTPVKTVPKDRWFIQI